MITQKQAKDLKAKQDLISAKYDMPDDVEECNECAGTGEGQAGQWRCSECKGTGIVGGCE